MTPLESLRELKVYFPKLPPTPVMALVIQVFDNPETTKKDLEHLIKTIMTDPSHKLDWNVLAHYFL